MLNRISIDFEHLNQNPQAFNLFPWNAPCVERMKSSSISIIAPQVLPDLSTSEAAALLRRISNQSLQEATVLGLAYIQRFFSEPNWLNRRFIKDLDEFLGAWNYVATWAGIGGALGQTNILKARIVLCQMLNDYLRVYDLAGAVASGLYANNHIKAARKWYELLRRFERRFNKPPWLLGPLELAEGNFDKAKLSF